MFFHFAVTNLFVIIVPCSGGSVEVLLKEGEVKCAEVLPKEEDKCMVAGVAVGIVALVKAVDVAMCERETWRNQLNNWTRSSTTTILAR